jgi:hypothetical protein
MYVKWWARRISANVALGQSDGGCKSPASAGRLFFRIITRICSLQTNIITSLCPSSASSHRLNTSTHRDHDQFDPYRFIHFRCSYMSRAGWGVARQQANLAESAISLKYRYWYNTEPGTVPCDRHQFIVISSTCTEGVRLASSDERSRRSVIARSRWCTSPVLRDHFPVQLKA